MVPPVAHPRLARSGAQGPLQTLPRKDLYRKAYVAGKRRTEESISGSAHAGCASLVVEGWVIRTKIRNAFGTEFSGALGKEMVAASWKGHEYIRKYAKPTNVNSELQEQHRAIFSQAVEAWHRLSSRARDFYAHVADGMTGYNLFVGRYVAAVRQNLPPEVPLPLTYVTADGQPVLDGYLIIRQQNRMLFVDSLKDGKGEIALTSSDAPYTFVLRKNMQEDPVLTVDDLLETDVPAKLESELLGIRLVLDVPTSPAPTPTPTAGQVVA